MTQYSLTCINESQLPGSFVVFQKPAASTVPGTIYPLAWLARPVHPTMQTTFEWTLDFNFVWSETGVLVPGITFLASQVIAADPTGQNMVELTVDSYGATYFSGPNDGGEAGRLTVRQLANVVPNRTAVGIGMSGAGTCAVQAAPNITAVFTPHPNYWVTFGNFEQGQVIDLEELPTVAPELTYTGSLASHTAILGMDNLIRIS